MVGSITGLLRIRRRGYVDAPHPEPDQLTSVEAPVLLSGSSTIKRSEKVSSVLSMSWYPIKSFAVALIMLAVFLHVNNNSLIDSANNSREEHMTVAKILVTPPKDETPSLRSAIYSIERRYPRTVIMNQSEPIIRTDDVPYTKNFDRNSIPSKAPLITSKWFKPNSLELVGGYNLKVCKPMHDWQSKSFPNCNMFHETNLSEMKFLASGTIKSVFALSENIDGHVNKFVYKTLDFNSSHKITPKRVNQERKDALILERTTGSRFIPNIHGWCSTDVLMENAPRDMEHYNKDRIKKNISISPLDRLKISIHIASGVADVHSAKYIHNDLHEQQFLFQDGVFKLNDFNFGKPMYIDTKTNSTCKLPKFNMGLFGRSLEELQYKVDKKKFSPATPDKVDVWIMGNLIYTILTDLQVWDKKLRSDENVKVANAKRLVSGKRPFIPKRIEKSTDPSHLAMKNALDMAWTYNWKERPSARAIADYLIGQLRTITGEDDPDFRINYLDEESR